MLLNPSQERTLGLGELIRTKIASTIERVGHEVIMTTTPDGSLTYAYTIGLEVRWNHPEIIIVNADVIARTVLNHVVRTTIAQGRGLVVGETLAADTVKLTVPLRVHEPRFDSPSGDISANCISYYYSRFPLTDGRQPRLLQILWPNVQGIWPEDDPTANQIVL
jgi:hypothetical protein